MVGSGILPTLSMSIASPFFTDQAIKYDIFTSISFFAYISVKTIFSSYNTSKPTIEPTFIYQTLKDEIWTTKLPCRSHLNAIFNTPDHDI